MSALTGRYANRIGHGFTIEGKHYDLAADAHGVTLHGGPPAYSRRVLQTVGTFQHAGDAGVTLRLASPDGDQGFPGAVTIELTYTLTDNNDFRIDYKATTDKTTVINLTNHTYYNLAGNGSGNVENQLMTVMADQVTPTDAIPGADRRIHQCRRHAVRLAHPHADRGASALGRSADADWARL